MNGVYFEQLKYQLLRHLSARYYSHFLEQCGVISTRSVEQLATNTLKKNACNRISVITRHSQL